MWLKRRGGRNEEAPGMPDRIVYLGESEHARRLSTLLLLDHHHPPFSQHPPQNQHCSPVFIMAVVTRSTTLRNAAPPEPRAVKSQAPKTKTTSKTTSRTTSKRTCKTSAVQPKAASAEVARVSHAEAWVCTSMTEQPVLYSICSL